MGRELKRYDSLLLSNTHASHISVLILEVRLSVVTDDPVSVGRGSTGLRVGGGNFSVQVVVEALEETFTKVHVANRVDAISKVDAAGNLAVPMSPVMLDTFHMPLVYDNDDLFTLGLINFAEEGLILLIDQDLFDFGEEHVSRLDVPIHVAGIETFLRESSGANHLKFLPIVDCFADPARVEVLESLDKVLRKIKASLVKDSLPSILIEFGAHEFELSASLLGGLTSKLDLEARTVPRLISETEVSAEHEVVETEAEHGQPLAIAIIVIEGAQVGPSVELRGVFVHLGLRVNVLHKASVAPPLRGCLDEDLVGAELFDQFLCSLGKHGRLIAGADEVDILTIESLGKVHQGCVEAVITIK